MVAMVSPSLSLNPTRFLCSSLLPSKFVQITLFASTSRLSSSLNQNFIYRSDPHYKSRLSTFNFITFCSSTDFQELRNSNNNSSVDDQLGTLLEVELEVEGVLADAHWSGNLLAFNLAFQNLGLDCANWTEPIYADLTRKAGGIEEKMVTLYFNQVGWPSTLPTNEHGIFVKRLLQEKKKALEDLQGSNELPLHQ